MPQKAHGSFNDGNNITLKFDPNVSFGPTSQDVVGGRLRNLFTVTLPSSEAGSSLVAHDGSHLEDRLEAMNGATPLTRFQSEIEAYQIQGSDPLGQSRPIGLLAYRI